MKKKILSNRDIFDNEDNFQSVISRLQCQQTLSHDQNVKKYKLKDIIGQQYYLDQNMKSIRSSSSSGSYQFLKGIAGYRQKSLTKSKLINKRRCSALINNEVKDKIMQKPAESMKTTRRQKWQHDGQKKSEKNTFFLSKATHLQNVIKNAKIKNITVNFIKKLKQSISRSNVTQATKIQLSFQKKSEIQEKQEWQGFYVNQKIMLLLEIISISFTVLLLIMNSILIAYDNAFSQTGQIVKTCAIFIYFLVLYTQIFSCKIINGKKVVKIKQLLLNINKQTLLIELVNIFILFLDINNIYGLKFSRMIILTKLPQMLERMQRVQMKLITSSYNQQYWSLVKILLFNFTFAHVLAVLLSLVAKLQPSYNWMTVKDINDCEWNQKYLWAYYWGINIMLTVGFGDISAKNSSQALSLIFIQTFSCLILAYNVNCIGEIIMGIRSKQLQKRQQLRVFDQLTRQNDLTQQLNWKINKHIHESINLKKNFNFPQQHTFIQSLPDYLKSDFLKQFNRSIFSQLPFFRYAMQKTIISLAQRIQLKMAHPQQIIRHYKDDFNLLILRSGQLSTICRKPQSSLHAKTIDIIRRNQSQQPFLLTLNFITKKQLPFQVKALSYSTFYFLSYQKIISTIKQTKNDYQYYAYLRDKLKNVPDQFQVIKCQLCSDRYHYKFDCPSLHYLPNKDLIIHKDLFLMKSQKVYERLFKVRNLFSYNCFQVYKYIQGDIQQKQKIGNFKFSYNTMMNIRFQSRYFTQNFEDVEVDNSSPFTITNQQYKSLKDIIAGEIQKVTRICEGDDKIWTIGLDTLFDYNKYFPNDNPSNLCTKFSPEQLRKLKRQKHSLISKQSDSIKNLQ